METDIMIRMQRHREYMDSCSVDETDYTDLESNLRMLQRVSEIENRSMGIYDTHKQEFMLLRWTFDREIRCKPEPGSNVRPDFFWGLIHPDELSFVIETETKAFSYVRTLPIDERKSYKLILDFRMKNYSGEYLTFSQQSMALKLDHKGEIWLILVYIDLLSGKVSLQPPCRKLVNLTTGKLCLFDDEEDCTHKLFTRQEVTILELIAQGFDSEEIAQKLFISLNTVNNHRKNILKKSKTKNTAQALLYAKRVGVI